MKLKICFIADELYTSGGKQRVLTQVANFLVENNEVTIAFTDKRAKIKEEFYDLDDRVNRVYSTYLYSSKSSLRVYGILRKLNYFFYEKARLPLHKYFYFPKMEIASYNKFFAENKYDIVIGVAARNSALLALAECSGKKIGWFHNTYEAYFATKGRSSYGQESLYKNILPALKEVLVLTDRDKRVYSNHFDVKFQRIYNPICIESNFRVTAKHTGSILFVGRLVYEQKGLGYISEILSYLREWNCEYSLKVVGKGPDEEKFHKDIQDSGLTNKVEFIEETKDISQYYANAKLLIVPSKYEGFGLVVTEAMSFGLPVVSFATEGPSEILIDEDCGFLIKKYDTEEFAEKIRLLLTDERLRIKMGEKAIQRANAFSVEKIKNQWNQVLHEVF